MDTIMSSIEFDKNPPMFLGPELPTSPMTDEIQPQSPLSPRGRLRPVRSRLGTELTGAAAERRPSGRQKRRISPHPKPILPATERRSHEKDLLDDKWDIAPDGSSAGREGRQFAVANVGNNGKIYLRPTIRPANQRYPQPNFVFPMTPPSTAGLDVLTAEKDAMDHANNPIDGSQWTTTSTTATTRKRYFLDGKTPTRPSTHHRRAVSDSTVRDGTSVARESDAGAFKIIISKPGDEPRPRTMEDMEPQTSPLLEISIPSWKLGTPRFTLQGTPVFRGSSYAPTEEFRSSNMSVVHTPPQFLSDSAISSKRPSPEPLVEESASRLPHPALLRATYLSTRIVIEPAMFDALTFKPTCNDRTIARYSSHSGAVTAATPPRLVAEITSPSFLDYELISDFFLTYRSFLDATELLRMLVARLRWALARDDEVGMVVRVRTFVAMRHWILNYFIDDFVVDYGLRMTFCDLLNDFVDELSRDPRGLKVQLKILAELKKCWRRVCAQYWDGPEFDSSQGPDIPIAPGGIAGHRDPSLDPNSFTPQLDMFPQRHSTRDGSASSKFESTSRIPPVAATVIGDRPSTPENQVLDQDDVEDMERRQTTSPVSILSVDVVSCSLPGKSLRDLRDLRVAHPGMMPLGAHPVVTNGIFPSADPVAFTPRALVGKRVRPEPGQSHKRNNSLSDSLREHGSTAEKLVYKNAEFLLSLPYSGSLVRGNVLPPSQPFVDMTPADNTPGTNPSRQTTLFQPHPATPPKLKPPPSAMSGPGMKKLLGSVRRALSTRGQGISPTQGHFLNIAPPGPKGATTNRLPGTAIVPQAPSRAPGRPMVRIDILGAEVAEDFKKAVREDAADGTRSFMSSTAATPRATRVISKDAVEVSSAHMDTSFDAEEKPERRPMSDLAITTGSKSIVIVDDTLPKVPSMTGALPAVNPSVEAFAASFLRNGGADPTPPNTPPSTVMGGTPRRSSYLLGHHVIRPAVSDDTLPPFIPDLATLRGRPSLEAGRPSADYVQQLRSRPPLSGVRGQLRQRSSRTRSNRSISHRRYASFQSAIAAQASTIRSFDETTQSAGSIASMSDMQMPEPLRVLRRRPGGDLRRAENIGDLDTESLRRSRSVGSLTTYSESIRTSYFASPDVDSSFADGATSSAVLSPEPDRTFSLGAMAEPKKRQPSLMSTHSSRPMRPSFEVAAQELRDIPDDTEDEGVEAALLKLEGKYPKKNKKPLRLSSVARNTLGVQSEPSSASTTTRQIEEPPKEVKVEHRHLHVANEGLLSPTAATDADVASTEDGSFMTLGHPRKAELKSFLSEGSEESYSSIPLLQRGLTDDGRSKLGTGEWTNISVLQGSDDGSPERPANIDQASPPHSFELVSKPSSAAHIGTEAGGRTAVPRNSEQPSVNSFLDVDDSDHDSVLSSEISVDTTEADADATSQNLFPIRATTVVSKLPTHPLGDPTSPPPRAQVHPPSPPMTLVQALQMSPKPGVPQVHEHQLWTQKPLPPTPDATPTNTDYNRHPLASPVEQNTAAAEPQRKNDVEAASHNKYSAHLPFILAFDSDILAQQFTLIEKDALNEINWKELIDMKWKNATNSDSRSWVDFLRNTDARGVEVVIARFNIMVKWAVSEIVLTQDVEERARCIIKFIHIAANCRRYRNFATTAQIAIALTCLEVSRLSKTWELVPHQDVRTLHELEALVSPTRNFYCLRAEMEGGGGGVRGTEVGCIPFVGIYTHDLLFNSQRPSEIASSPATPPLVNFERCRVGASIVKTLLRLLEASTLYGFQPIEGITERCLWMSALSDEEIRRHSKGLE